MSDLREEEAEVLKSIYDETELKIFPNFLLEFKVGERDTTNSFVVQIRWPEGYPDVLPQISLDSFYNAHLPIQVKEQIAADLTRIAEEQLGTAFTFSLLDFLRENSDKYLKKLRSETTETADTDCSQLEVTHSQGTCKPLKKSQMSKAQKRKQFDRLGQDGELPRGWNWVSVIKHLQQTG